MGHLSTKRLEIMKRQYPFISVRNYFVCNTCHLPKQRKLHNSNFRTTCRFDLMHVDIRGSCSSVSKNDNKYFLNIFNDNTHF